MIVVASQEEEEVSGMVVKSCTGTLRDFSNQACTPGLTP